MREFTVTLPTVSKRIVRAIIGAGVLALSAWLASLVNTTSGATFFDFWQGALAIAALIAGAILLLNALFD